ncbi:hypothetical protein [Sphingobium sp.]|uniref:hypothetical protein n=1 Tax=Sphingobium sp. TaxID=1912891 RepID=UPI002C235494|nr:hypothetical protein [Sphingobium sp.]HUD91927.1 hypothetical protein [Sphingobium sp.]
MTAPFSRRAIFPIAAAMTGAGFLSAGKAATADDRVLTTVLEAGAYRITANVTIKTDLVVHPGATIEVTPGATLTVLGCLHAPVAPVFTGGGTIDLNRSRTPHAHPEWWGAAPGDGNRDSLPAFKACLAAHPVMQLLPADYYLSDTFVVERPFCRIAGAGFRGTEGWRGTRLILTNGAGDVLRVGPASRPATVNDYPQNIDIRSLALCRLAPVDGRGGRLPAGMTAQFLLYANFEQISAAEHGVGFVARGLVRTRMIDCIAFRSLPGAGAGQPWRGFLLDGMGDIGLAGGNASLFLIDCNATIGGNPQIIDGVGLLFEGAFADSFIINFEATAIATGIRIDGKAGQIGGRARNGHVNLHLRMPIVDQCGETGIMIRDTGPHMMIDISEAYVAVGPRATAAIHCAAMRGSVSITGGQLVGMTNSDANGQAAGLLARDSEGLQMQGLKILDHPRPVELSGCRGFALQGWIANPGHATGRAAAQLRDCALGQVSLLIGGRDRAFASGVRLDGNCQRLRIDVTGHDDGALQDGANGRAHIGDKPATLPWRRDGILIDGA